VLLDGKPVLLLCSNNYLGLADHPAVRSAAADAATRWGVGAGASRLVSGSMTIHRRLEERLATFKGTDSCVLFGSGYLANMGTLAALAGPGDVIYSDELNHASIVDGCRLSGAEVVVYRHCDMAHLEWCMRARRNGANSVIVTDSVFSMDADVAPLAQIVELADEYNARVMVDEAHATGTTGPGGRGAVAEAGLESEVDVIVGTLGKALGSYGAFVCGQETTIQYLVNRARPLIFSTAPAPPAVAGALAALELLESRPHRVERLHRAARTLRGGLQREGFGVPETEMHIVPLVVGDEHAALALCQGAIEQGIFVQAIRPPSVPAQTTRLRLTVMASHTAGELRAAARALGRLARAQGLDPATMGSPELESEPVAEPAAMAAAVGLPEAATGAQPSRGAAGAGAAAALMPTEALDVPAQWLGESDQLQTSELALDTAAPFDHERDGGMREAA
jgi:glycine C-acetyltransferase/8-amino-7-oxononanoate synthase